MTRTVRALAAALAVAACVATTSPGASSLASLQLPTHRDLGGGPTALLTAQLVEEGGCVYATSTEGRSVPVWPTGYRLDGSEIKKGDQTVASLGSSAKLGGGGYDASQLDFLRTLMDSPLPTTCQASNYWLVTEVVP